MHQRTGLLAHRRDHGRVAVADEQTEIPARKSRYSLPSESQSRAPSPRTNSTGARL